MLAETQAQGKVVVAEATLAGIQVMACGLVYEQVFNRGTSRDGGQLWQTGC